MAEEGYNGKVTDPKSEKEVNEKRVQAYLRMVEGQERLGLGVFFEIDLPTYEDKIGVKLPSYKETPPAKETIVGPNGKPGMDISEIIDEYAVKQF